VNRCIECVRDGNEKEREVFRCFRPNTEIDILLPFSSVGLSKDGGIVERGNQLHNGSFLENVKENSERLSK